MVCIFDNQKILKLARSLFLLSSIVFFQGCSKSGLQTTSTDSAIQGASSTAVRIAPVVTPASPTNKIIPEAQGQILGSCMYQLNSSFAAITVPAQNTITWPMLTCDAQLNATCAAGFKVINDAPIQMNCATNSSTDLVNCYWATKRCVRDTGTKDLSAFVRGQSYGGCLAQLNDSFAVTHIDYTAWPMLSCDTSGNSTCASGFQAVKETPVQMNCSTNPSKTNTTNCYWMTTRCLRSN